MRNKNMKGIVATASAVVSAHAGAGAGTSPRPVREFDFMDGGVACCPLTLTSEVPAQDSHKQPVNVATGPFDHVQATVSHYPGACALTTAREPVAETMPR